MKDNENADNRSLEQQIYDELCDVLDMPEAYEDCVLGIHKTTHHVSVASPMTFNKEYRTFPLMDMFSISEESQEYEVDVESVRDVLSYFE